MRKNKSNPIQQLLIRQGKGKSEPSGVKGQLAALYRSILDDISMNTMWWENLMNEFLSDYAKGVTASRKKITSMRGNLIKELGKDEMTWKVFYKGLRYLQPIRAEFSVRIHWRSKRITEHTKMLEFGDRANLAELLDELKETDEDEKDDKEDKE